jgi:multidrug resistance efflux pump
MEGDDTARAKDIAAAMTEYRKSLGKLLAVYEGSLAKAVERREQRRALYDRGVIGQSAIDDAETEVTTTQQKVDSTRREMAEVDRKLAEPIPPPTTRWVGFTALRYQCWPVGVNP